MSLAILAQLLEGGETDVAGAGGKFDVCEGVPEVFAEGSGDGFLAVEGELREGCVVLFSKVSSAYCSIKENQGLGVSDCKGLKGGKGDRNGERKRGQYTFIALVKEYTTWFFCR